MTISMPDLWRHLVLGAGLLAGLSGSPAWAQSGQAVSRTVSVDGTDRTYTLYVPAAYDGASAWPLVVNFHGYTGRAEWQISTSRMNEVADTAHVLVAYPNGLVVGPSETGWHIPGTGLAAPQDDVAFTEHLIDQVATEFRVDPARVHATGYSQGGEMSFYLACALPGRIASVAGVAGYMTNALLAECETPRPFSILQMHGTDDDTVPYRETTPAFWADRNGCAASPTATDLPNRDPFDGSTVTLVEYTGCDAGAEVVFYQVDGGGHTWPGGAGGIGLINRDVNASAEILAFFARTPHPERGTSADDTGSAHDLFEVGDGYPNPSSHGVAIEYRLAQPAAVTLRVYDALGRHVRALEDAVRPPGAHVARWDGRDDEGRPVASGVYVYRLDVAGHTVTRTTTLVR